MMRDTPELRSLRAYLEEMDRLFPLPERRRAEDSEQSTHRIPWRATIAAYLLAAQGDLEE